MKLDIEESSWKNLFLWANSIKIWKSKIFSLVLQNISYAQDKILSLSRKMLSLNYVNYLPRTRIDIKSETA